MIWLYLTATLCTAAFALSIYLGHRDFKEHGKRNYGMWRGQYVLLAAVFATLSLASILVAIIVPANKAYDGNVCRNWSKQTGRETRFVTYNVFAWDCLTLSRDGKWIPIDSYGDYNRNG
jgi:hypothetical protein